MTAVRYRLHQCLSGFQAMPAIPALLRPGLHEFPIAPEIRVLGCPLSTIVIKASDLKQLQ
jgi:hypothetical protein